MFESDKKSPLERLNKSLYSRTDEVPSDVRPSIHEKQSFVPETWVEDTSGEESVEMKATRKTYRYLFGTSLLFFLVAVSIGGYTLFGGRNFVSADNVNVLIEGPVTITGGEPLNLDVSVVNKNATDIENVDLIVEYPDGTKDPNDPSIALSRIKIPLGSIKSQSVSQKSISSVLFGEEGAQREIKFKVEYQTANSGAVFFKEKFYNISISSSPLIVTIDALEKVLSGQAADFSVTISSNTTNPIKNVLLVLDYPFGFSVVSSNPVATYGDNVWKIGDLAPGSKRTIKIKATAQGQDEEERTIRANVGIQSESSDRDIATTIVSRSHSFVLEKPFLGLDVVLDGNRDDLAVAPGRSMRAEIIWTNNSSSKITNARIEAKIVGNVLNKNSVTVEGGYYDSLANTIVWEAGRVQSLNSISPGEDGRVGFTFSSNASFSGSITNPQISITVSAQGSRVDTSGVPQEITAAITRSVKLLSNLSLSARALHNQGPIANSGPIPPRAENATTYTIVWTVTNTSNNITGAKVVARLPQYVKWTDTVSPSSASISYNPTGGIVTWNVGSVPINASGTGNQQVSFQVSVTPSANQIGTSPDIIGSAKITGLDSFTGVVLEDDVPSLSTRTSSDLLFKTGDEVVVE